MANNIAWQPQSLQTIRFNPNEGLQLAQNAAKSILTTGLEQDRATSLAAHRKSLLAQKALEAENLNKTRIDANILANRRQNFVEGAPERAIAEEARLLKNSAEQGILANKIADEAGFSRRDSFFENPDNQRAMAEDPRFQSLAGLPGGGVGPLTPQNQAAVKDFNDQFVAQNKRLLSDPTAYRNQVVTELLASKKFSRTDANAIADQKTKELFPTMDPAVAIKLFQKPGAGRSGGTGTGRSTGGGTNKLLSSAPDAIQEQQLIDNYVSNNDIPVSAAFELFGLRPFDFNIKTLGGERDATKQDVVKYVSQMSQAGVPAYASLGVLQQLTSPDGNIPFDLENMTPKEKEKVVIQAQGIINTQNQTFNSKGAGTSLLAQQDAERRSVAANNNAILSRLNPDQSTREKRISTFLSGLPGQATKTPTEIVRENVIDTDATTAPPAGGVNAGILAPPVQNQPVLDTAAPRASLAVNHNQGIIDLVNDKLSNEVAPTQQEAIAALAEIKKKPFLLRQFNPGIERLMNIAAQGGDPFRKREGRGR